jgi:hypothetical protein
VRKKTGGLVLQGLATGQQHIVKTYEYWSTKVVRCTFSQITVICKMKLLQINYQANNRFLYSKN